MEFNLKSILLSLKDEFKSFSLKKKISEEDFERIWEEVIHKVKKEPPPKIALIGNCGVGKSSTLNSLFNFGQSINHTGTNSQQERLLEIIPETIDGEKGNLKIYDLPGLGTSIKSNKKHLETYNEVLSGIDVAIWILEASGKGLKSIKETLLNDIKIINPSLVNRIVFALNKVDIIYPGQCSWNTLTNLPSEEQELKIAEGIKDIEEIIKKIIPEWNGQIIGYSAEKRYNLTKLFKTILDAVPEERKWVVASRKALSQFIDLVDANFLPGELKRDNK